MVIILFLNCSMNTFNHKRIEGVSARFPFQGNLAGESTVRD